jgi:FkbM family methyltransferase
MIFDIGSNIGDWTSANINNSDKFITIEASPSTYKKMYERHGNNSKVVCLNYAVCNNNCEDVTFYDCSCHFLSTLNVDWLSSEKSRFYGEKYTEIKVPSITIDKLIETYGNPELIKIDVEGGEDKCITSLTKKVPQLCFEWASETNDVTIRCLNHLYSLGFTDFYLQNNDNYTFRPSTYTSFENVIEQLNKTTPKVDWGMLWCR